MDISRIKNPQAKIFITTYSVNREINREFYTLVPEGSLDFRMVDTPKRKSDSPRDSISHQISVARCYIQGVRTGILEFGAQYKDLDNPKLTKKQLLQKLEQVDNDLIRVLEDPKIDKKLVKVPWSKIPIPAVTSLWSLNSHEVLHTGWNLAVMDHIGIPRFPALKKVWG